MKNSLMFSVFCVISLVVSSCANGTKMRKQNDTIPECVNSRIAEVSKADWGCESGKSIKQYTFQGKTVYALEPGNCGSDMATLVYDSDCKQLGFLGGIMGNTKINDEEFANAVFVKTVWSN